MPDKPLHVQVAETLGWTDLAETPSGWFGTDDNGAKGRIPPFDKSWCEIGPLVAKYKLSILFDDGWQAWSRDYDVKADGKTPMEAICHLIVQFNFTTRKTA